MAKNSRENYHKIYTKKLIMRLKLLNKKKSVVGSADKYLTSMEVHEKRLNHHNSPQKKYKLAKYGNPKKKPLLCVYLIKCLISRKEVEEPFARFEFCCKIVKLPKKIYIKQKTHKTSAQMDNKKKIIQQTEHTGKNSLYEFKAKQVEWEQH